MNMHKEDVNRTTFSLKKSKEVMKKLTTVLGAEETGNAVVEVTDVDLECGVKDIVRLAKLSKDNDKNSDVAAADILGDDMGQGLHAKDVDEEAAAIVDELEGVAGPPTEEQVIDEPDEDREETPDPTIVWNQQQLLRVEDVDY